MLTIDSLMDLGQNILHFIFLDAFEQGNGESSSIQLIVERYIGTGLSFDFRCFLCVVGKFPAFEEA
jgi:hypothetical protein